MKNRLADLKRCLDASRPSEDKQAGFSPAPGEVAKQLSKQEKDDLYEAILALEKGATYESLSPAQQQVWLKWDELFDELVRRSGGQYAAQQEARRQQLKALTSRTPSEEKELSKLEEDAKRTVKIGR
jgi:hypothetical protein